MFIQVVTTSFHLLWCHLFVNVLGMGIAGTGAAYSLTNLINIIATQLYMTRIPALREACIWPSAESFTGFRSFMKLGLPSMAVIFLEQTAFELLLLLGGYVGMKASAA